MPEFNILKGTRNVSFTSTVANSQALSSYQGIIHFFLSFKKVENFFPESSMLLKKVWVFEDLNSMLTLLNANSNPQHRRSYF